MKYNSISRQTEHQKEPLACLLREIVGLADPEKIFLLSAGFEYRLTENIFQKTPAQAIQAKQYQLLILMNTGEKSALAKLEINLMQIGLRQMNFQFALMDIAEFNKKVEAGDPYWGFILFNAMLSYDSGRIGLAIPSQQVL